MNQPAPKPLPSIQAPSTEHIKKRLVEETAPMRLFCKTALALFVLAFSGVAVFDMLGDMAFISEQSSVFPGQVEHAVNMFGNIAGSLFFCGIGFLATTFLQTVPSRIRLHAQRQKIDALLDQNAWSEPLLQDVEELLLGSKKGLLAPLTVQEMDDLQIQVEQSTLDLRVLWAGWTTKNDVVRQIDREKIIEHIKSVQVDIEHIHEQNEMLNKIMGQAITVRDDVVMIDERLGLSLLGQKDQVKPDQANRQE